uniref:Uncharacterized protein n=1 Tax=Solanum lycopersicum TaxID=4081 RepID=A0A3Q7FJ01_SOLLC
MLPPWRNSSLRMLLFWVISVTTLFFKCVLSAWVICLFFSDLVYWRVASSFGKSSYFIYNIVFMFMFMFNVSLVMG